MSTVLIRHIALSNLGFTFYIATWTVTIASRSNVYPDVLCCLFRTWGYVCLITELLLVAVLSVCKLTWMLRPLRSLGRSKRLGRRMAAAAWTLSGMWCAGYFLAIQLGGSPEVKFRDATYLCAVDPGSKVLKRVMGFARTTIVSVSEIVLLVSTVWLLCFVRKTMGRLQKQALVTTLLISGTYFVSFIPSVLIYRAFREYVLTDSQQNTKEFSVFYSTCQFLTLFNCAANPVLYCFTIKSYGLFVGKFFKASCDFVKGGKFEIPRETNSFTFTN